MAVFYGVSAVHTGPGVDNAEVAGPVRLWLGKGADNGFVMDGNPLVRGDDGADHFLLWTGGDPEQGAGFHGARVDGGAGHDSLQWAMNWPMHLDARKGRVTSKGSVLGPRRNTDATFRGIETFGGSGSDDTMIGHDGHDEFRGSGGHDVLLGYGGRDVLLGGPGRDVANGGPGLDTCRAERRRACERR